MDNNANEYNTIDLMRIAKALLNRVWLIIWAGVLTAAIGLLVAAVFITPQYSSSIMLYVNNSSENSSTQGGSISSSDLSASQNLVKTYAEILKSRTTIEEVIALANVDFTYKQVSKFISASASNNTEVMKVTVTMDNAYEAADIANAVAAVLPGRIAEIIDGSSMKVVDSAIVSTEKVSPSITKYTLIGAIIGIVVACGVIAVTVILDDTIHDEEYVIQTFGCPVLAKIPDLSSASGSHYGKYGHGYGYGYGYGYGKRNTSADSTDKG